MLFLNPEVDGRSRVSRALLRIALRGLARHSETLAFRFRGQNLIIANDLTAVDHALLSTSKLARMVETIPSPPSAVIDVGANCGHFAALLSRRFPRSRVVAIEPNPRLRDVI